MLLNLEVSWHPRASSLWPWELPSPQWAKHGSGLQLGSEWPGEAVGPCPLPLTLSNPTIGGLPAVGMGSSPENRLVSGAHAAHVRRQTPVLQCAASGHRDTLPIALLSLSYTQWTGRWVPMVITYNCFIVCFLSAILFLRQMTISWDHVPSNHLHLHLYTSSASGGASLAQGVGQAPW